MTKNRVLDELRALERRPRAVVALDDIPPLEVVDQPFERSETIDAVWRAVEGLTVDLKMDGDFDTLPDKHRTCVYRIVQEAMTNCVRHAHAKNIQIGVLAEGDQLHVSVYDDGVGLDPAHRRKGLGLRGIEERVEELQGTMRISRESGRGTKLMVHLPLPIVMEEPFARAAG